MRMAYGERFDVPAGYLNTASIGVPPAFAADAMAEVIDRWRRGEINAPEFDQPVATARAAWARIVGVDADRVAIASGVSQLVGQVASGIPDGTRVLVAAGEFTSATFPFAAQGRGITVTEVPLAQIAERASEFDLVAVSVVQSADGSIVDLAGLRASGTRVLLDVTQAAGWLPLDLGWADWVVGGSYKWLMSPRGSAWLAIRPDAEELTKPVGANWYAGEDPWDTVYGLPLRLASSARAFDLSPDWFAQVGAASALPWLAGLDMNDVHAHCVGLADKFLAGMDLPPAGSAIVSIDRPAESLIAAGIRCASRAGRTRLAFHLYSTEEDVDLALAALR
ncbi:aminotransferase class V-fold PLP-dependent enzyme [Actinokineospora alba]|nr:aminotransferase class V-fold PLP-dependent enzyme [Actinokineospora alba]